MCPPKLFLPIPILKFVLWLQVPAWGVELLLGLGVDEPEPQSLPTPLPRQHLILTLIKGYN